MLTALILVGALVGWPQAGASFPSSAPSTANTYSWVQPHPGQAGRDYNPWPFYGDPLVGPREVVCYKADWYFIDKTALWYPGVCWSQRIHRRYVY